MEQSAIKKQILELSRDESQDNKRCIDCGSPHPQWSSVTNSVFLWLALSCSRLSFELILCGIVYNVREFIEVSGSISGTSRDITAVSSSITLRLQFCSICDDGHLET